MLKTVIKKDMYKDSVALMILNNKINEHEAVNIASIMMASPANKDMFNQSGLLTEEVEKAGGNDIAIVLDLKDESQFENIIKIIDDELTKSEKKSAASASERADTLEEALDMLPEANLAMISVPGIYAYSVAKKCLDKDLNVFMFSDNVALDEEIKLKTLADEKGLLVMGPDCGTSVINGIPLCFANKAKAGKIGIVGASGTGIQEIISVLDSKGYGISQAIGTGGRDLKEEIGARSLLKGIKMLADDPETEVILVLSKPPADSIKAKVEAYLKSIDKPSASLFLGEIPDHHYESYYKADTLEELASLGIDLLEKRAAETLKSKFEVKSEGGKIKALYTGGTLATEAAVLLMRALGTNEDTHTEKHVLDYQGHEIIDLGDDFYTQGKPHPMIDPNSRLAYLKAAAEDKDTKVILLDIVIGYGSNEDPAHILENTIKEIKAKRSDIEIIVTICGTDGDFQSLEKQKSTVENAGAKAFRANKQAVDYALSLIGLKVEYKEKTVQSLDKPCQCSVPEVQSLANNLLDKKLKIVNIGLAGFGEALKDFNADCVQYDFKPIAGGKKELMEVLEFLDSWKKTNENLEYEDIDSANQAVIARVVKSNPVLQRVKPGHELIPELKKHVILHAGPPIKYENMTEPMQGSCVGAILFEGWAQTEEEAFKMLEAGEITFMPCHNCHAVGPMGGITTMNMPMLVVEDTLNETVGYCIMNEGIGKVLRFGAYDKEVVDRLKWMAETLGPVLDKAVVKLGGVGVNPLIAQAIAMGDEFHQRNIAASSVFLRTVAPTIAALDDVEEVKKQEVIKFLAVTDQFFLNVAMATGKAIMDGARKLQEGTVVTAMCRNGENFGIKIAGMGDEWFQAPVNTPKGLYFTGFSEADANPDIGDSAITETIGFGGMAMIAAPAVTRFVGTGGFSDALNTSNKMQKITISHNPNYIIPTWDFKGATLGIDARKVVETGITPVINTGIANKKAGIGQIGAGTVNPPLECFEQAIVAYAKKLGYDSSK